MYAAFLVSSRNHEKQTKAPSAETDLTNMRYFGSRMRNPTIAIKILLVVRKPVFFACRKLS